MITIPPPRKGDTVYAMTISGTTIVYKIVKVIKPKKAKKT